jgi:hypothetical protein
MSYIHDALKKAQREKESLAQKCSILWSGRRVSRVAFKREWLVSACVVLAAFGFSAFSWFSSLNQFVTGEPNEPLVHRGQVTPPVAAPNPGPAPAPRQEPASRPPATLPETPATAGPPQAGMPARATQPIKTQQEAPKTDPEMDATSLQDGAGTLYTRALGLQKQGRLAEAKELYEAALKRSPSLVSALNNLGTIYVQENNLTEARKALEKAIRIDPGYGDAYYNLACLHARQNDIGRGLFYLKKAISINEMARQWAKTDEDLQSLRGHPEYEEVLAATEKP